MDQRSCKHIFVAVLALAAGCQQPIICPLGTRLDERIFECVCDADARALLPPDADYCLLADGGIVPLPGFDAARPDGGMGADAHGSASDASDPPILPGDSGAADSAPMRDAGPDPANASLIRLEIDNGALAPAFESSIHDYSVDARGPAVQVTVAVDFPARATLSVDGVVVASGVRQRIELTSLIQTIRVRVNSSDGPSDYRVVVKRRPTYVKPPNPGIASAFGRSVAWSADRSTLVVGAFLEDSAAVGVNATFDTGSPNSGAAYVFARTGNTWTLQAYLKASNTGAEDQFGSSVAISADGSTVAIGAPEERSSVPGIDGPPNRALQSAGAVYVFRRSGTNWRQEAFVKASNPGLGDRFGFSLSLSSDGSALAVGAPNEDSSATTTPDELAADSGAVYVFIRSSDAWAQQAYVKASNVGEADNFGTAVALSGNGALLLVGVPFEDSSGTTPNDALQDSGAAYQFVRTGSAWLQRAFLKASNPGADDQFGTSVAFSDDATIAVVGAPYEDSASSGVNSTPNELAPDSGAVYTFISRGMLQFDSYLKASSPSSGDLFGATLSVSMDANAIAVGAPQEDSTSPAVLLAESDNARQDSGAAYLFTRSGASSWALSYVVKASNPDLRDQAAAVALGLDSSSLVLCAPGESSNSTGVNGSEVDNSIPFSGACYIY